MTTGGDERREAGSRLVVAITGSSGLIGSALARSLETRGHVVKRVVRRAARNANEIAWDPQRGHVDERALAGVDAVVNLAGENIAQRWTGATRARIRASRVSGTLLLSRALARVAPRPRVLVSGSAIGIYGDHRDDLLDEHSSAGDDFLATVCRDWEAATAPAADTGVRVVLARTGIVLARGGGALHKMLIPIRLFAGGQLGDGRQWMSWIALRDEVRALEFLLDADQIIGPVNLTAPTAVTNAELTREIARIVHRPAALRVPAFALKTLLGTMATGTVLASQRVVPRRLTDAGFVFAHPRLESALRAELGAAAAQG